MEQNNFEKNIQQKLDGLKIHPSDSIWLNIEKRIGRKHKDRRVFFILFFLILFLLSGGYRLFNLSKNTAQQDQQISDAVKKNSNLSAIIKSDSTLITPVISSGVNPEKPDVVTVTEKKLRPRLKNQSPALKDKYDIGRINQNQKKLSYKVAFKPNKKILPGESTNKERINNAENEIGLKSFVESTGISKIEDNNENADLDTNLPDKINPDNFSNQLKLKKMKSEIVSKNDSTAKKHANNRQKTQWVLGATFSGGRSRMVHDPLGIDKSSSDYLQSSPNSGGGSGSGGNPSSFNPSEIKNSVAFIGGAFIEKNISAKSKMSLGISYKYFSLTNKVGNQSSARSNQYSAANTVNSYRNNFHYLEFPVSIKLQLNNAKALPLFWQAGINISQLISSNALQFQSSPGLYYNDNSMFNKTQFGLSTGISAVLFSKQKVPVTIGPYFYYSASKLSDKGLYQNKHFSFIGLRTEILFQNNRCNVYSIPIVRP